MYKGVEALYNQELTSTSLDADADPVPPSTNQFRYIFTLYQVVPPLVTQYHQVPTIAALY